jgi:hypothetical protein
MFHRRFCAAVSITLFAGLFASAAPAIPAGRWEGSVQTPSAPIVIVLDLESAGGSSWMGSAIFPAFGVKGAPLKDIKVEGAAFACTVKSAMGEPKITAKLAEDGTLSGTYEQGGHSLPVSFKRVGDAQVDLPRRSTPIQKELEGEWRSVLVVGDFKMQLVLKLDNPAQAAASGSLSMSGGQPMPVEFIAQQGDGLELTVPAANFGYEGRFDKSGDELKGVLRAGSLELPLAWHRPSK